MPCAWVQTQQRAAALVLLTALASVLLVLGGILGWRTYADSIVGRIRVSTPGTPFRVHVLDDRSEPVAQAFPTSIPGFETEPVTLPKGDCNVQLSAPGQRSETYRLLVQSGVTYNFQLTPEQRRPWEPLRLEEGDSVDVVENGGLADLVVVDSKGLHRLRGANRELVKDWGTGPLAELPIARFAGLKWTNVMRGAKPQLVHPAPVVKDKEGEERLLIWASRSSPSLVAASSRTGRLQWWHQGKPALPQGIKEWDLEPGADGVIVYQGRVVTTPVLADVDGTPILLAAFASEVQPHRLRPDAQGPGRPPQVVPEPEEWVEAIDARTGKMLWRVTLRGLQSPQNRKDPGIHVFSVAGRAMVAVLAGQRFLGLDLQSGKTEWSHDLGPLLGDAVQTGDRSAPRFGTFGSPREPGVLLAFHGVLGGNDLNVAAISYQSGMRRGIERKHLVWEWPWPGGDGQVMRVLGTGQSTTVAARAGNAVHGLDARTGRERLALRRSVPGDWLAASG